MIRITHNLQKGFSLITAIFLLVVMGALGTMMVTFFVAQQQSSALDVMGSRAYQAARAGVERAAYNVEAGAGCATYTAIPSPLFTAGTGTALTGTLSTFNVSLACDPVPVVDDTITTVYGITSTAVYGGAPGNPDYVERVLSAKMGR